MELYTITISFETINFPSNNQTNFYIQIKYKTRRFQINFDHTTNSRTGFILLRPHKELITTTTLTTHRLRYFAMGCVRQSEIEPLFSFGLIIHDKLPWTTVPERLWAELRLSAY